MRDGAARETRPCSPSALLALVAALALGACAGQVRIQPLKSFAGLDYGMPEKFVTLGGVRLCYVDLPARGKSDEVLVLLAPSVSPLSVWRDVAPALTTFGRVIAIDLPGFGKSDKPPRFRYHADTFAEVVARLLDHLGVSTATLVGNSIGGGTSLAFALAYPERTRRLVLAAPAGLGPASGWKQRGVRWAITRNQVRGALWASRLFLNTTLFGAPNEKTDRYVSDAVSVARVEGEFDQYIAAQRKILGNAAALDLSGRLKELKAPTLVVWGDRDRILRRDLARVVEKRVRGAEVAVLPGVGHMPEVERPDAFATLALAFLRRTPPSPAATGAKPSDAAKGEDDDGDDTAAKDDDGGFSLGTMGKPSGSILGPSPSRSSPGPALGDDKGDDKDAADEKDDKDDKDAEAAPKK